MQRIFILSKENIELAKEEVLDIAKPKKWKLADNVLTVETEVSLDKLERLAFTRKIDGKELKHKFGLRKPHLRPGFHPSSLNPKLARAIVNLTGIEKGKILDPFCGVCGILIEAGLIGLFPVGYDIDEEMLKKAELNFRYFGIKRFILEKKDARKLKKKFNYV